MIAGVRQHDYNPTTNLPPPLQDLERGSRVVLQLIDNEATDCLENMNEEQEFATLFGTASEASFYDNRLVY